MDRHRHRGRPRGLAAFLVVYAALYGAYGTQSPFLPAFLAERGLSASAIGLVLAGATLVRLAAGPVFGRLADRLQAGRAVLGAAALAAGLVSFAYLPAHGVWPLAAVALVQAAALAPLAPLADALALAAARGAFPYGRVRGVGSGAFILGTLASGHLVAAAGLASIVVTSGALFLGLAAATRLVPAAPIERGDRAAGVRDLLALAPLRRLMLVGALVLGSHALHDAFAVIRWREAGLGPGTVGALWSVAVAAEVVVFLALGEPILARLGPARCAALAALVAAARWAAMALTTAVPALAVAQLAHGVTFALLHLSAMRLIAGLAPAQLAATAQTLYGTFALGLASALVTAASGPLYGRFGAGAFWAMAALALAALPLAPGLARPKP